MKKNDKDLVKYNRKILKEIENFEDNWNGYDAAAFNKDYVREVADIVEHLYPAPEVFPTANSSIQLEYEDNDYYLEFEIMEDMYVKMYAARNNTFEKGVSKIIAVSDLQKYVDRFNNRMLGEIIDEK